MGCASSIHISDRVVYHSGKESEDSHSPQQTNATQHQGNPLPGLPHKAPNCKVRDPTLNTITQRMKRLFFKGPWCDLHKVLRHSLADLWHVYGVFSWITLQSSVFLLTLPRPWNALSERSQGHGSVDQAEVFMNDGEICICCLFQARVCNLSQNRHAAKADSFYLTQIWPVIDCVCLLIGCPHLRDHNKA